MILDVHVHVSAFVPEHGHLSDHVQGTLPFRIMRRALGFRGADAATEAAIADRLLGGVQEAAPVLDAAVVLAFDAVYAPDGVLDRAHTHLVVANDYARDLARQSGGRLLYGASVHPYRPDAVTELERVARDGAVLIKWLPITQGMDPSEARCVPFYEALADLGLPLLCHTGGERTLPSVRPDTADPRLLAPALERGVRVIMAHCGTRSVPSEPCYLDAFMRLARDHEHCYGDTSALNLPTRSYAYGPLMADATVRAKLLHGSDWPVMPLPSLRRHGLRRSLQHLRERNWIRRDVQLKQQLGFDDDYWHRAARVLRLPGA